MSLKSLKPSPPCAFACNIFSQAYQCVLRFPSLNPKNSYGSCGSNHQTPSGILKTLIIKVGIAWARDFINVSFPAWVGCPSNANSLLLTFSYRFWSLPLVSRPSGVGKPKYFSSKPELTTSNTPFISAAILVGKESPKRIEDFAGFNSWTVDCS